MLPDVNPPRSLATRAVLAMALMIGFYGLALAIAGALLWIPYAELHYTHRLHGRITIACVVAAAGILWALVPRRDRFEPPGPRLDETNAPQLLKLVNDVAAETGQARPSEIYLLDQVNAWVSHRGGVMGFGSRRVMGVGLPLIQMLTPAELRAVIAHEFGHYSGGDVALGPWIYKTRGAIGRALNSLQGSWLEAIFTWYGRMFMRVTMAVSRQQEFTADAVAASVAGADVAGEALRKVAIQAPAYDIYLKGDVYPVLNAGYLPPIVEGWQEFMARARANASFAAYAEERTTGDTAGDFDSHPSMADRIAALARLGGQASRRIEPAGPVLADPERWTRTLLSFHAGESEVAKLQPLEWSEVGTTIWASRWQSIAEHYAAWFDTLTVERIPAGQAAYAERSAALYQADEQVSDDERLLAAVRVMSAGLGAALLRAGWQISARPGESVAVVRVDRRLDPAAVVIGLVEGTQTAADWQARCDELGISGLPLQPVATAPS